MLRKQPITVMLLAMLAIFPARAIADDICINAVPQAASLSSEGTLGLSLGASQESDGSPSPYFSSFSEYPADGPCFGAFVTNSMVQACDKFLQANAPLLSDSPASSKPEVESCEQHDSEIEKLQKQNRRLKNRLKRLRAR